MTGVKLEWLFKPISIGKLRIPNRIVMSPMDSGLSNEEGFITSKLIDTYEARATGGVGLVDVEATCIDSKTGKVVNHNIVIDDDRYIPGLKELTKRIQRHGSRIAIQLNHGGAFASRQLMANPLSCSEFITPDGRKTRAMSRQDIVDTIEHFAKAAVRAKKAGFDGVEIHAAHGFLLAQFLSPSFNVREDEYGGKLENRARFLLETIKAVREAVGRDYPFWVRINGIEWKKNGLSSEEAVAVARLCEAAGVNAVNVSAYAIGSKVMWRSLPPEEGALLPYAAAIKAAIKIPVIAVGFITPELGNKAIHEGKADLIAIARGLLADPELPRKAKQQRLDEIRPCIGCMNCLYGIMQSLHRECTVNPTVGKEKELAISKARKSKTVLVVGGGPGGMEVARTAALRGHKVTLYDKNTTLGGQLTVATVPPHKERIQKLTDYFKGQLRSLGIGLELGTEVTPELVRTKKPDIVVVAAGIVRSVPKIPGLDKADAVSAEDVLSGDIDVGHEVIVIGGGVVGCETAEYMAEKGKKVVVCEILEEVATKAIPPQREMLIHRLEGLGVRIITRVTFNEVSRNGASITCNGKQEFLRADTIVNAASVFSNQDLVKKLEKEEISVHSIGDCVQPRGIKEAIDEGFRLGLSL